MTSRRLTAALTRTLEVKAEQTMDAGTPAPTFDPTRRPSALSDETDRRAGTGRRRRQRRLLLPAAALILVLALSAAGAIALHGGSSGRPVTTVTLGDAPGGWLVPTWVPGGMELWGVESSSSSGPSQSPEPGTIPQLFGDPGSGQVLFLTSFRYELSPATAEQVTVRGHIGHAGRGWDAGEADVGDAITWDEHGATITALYKGMTRDEAIDALDSLEWRSGDPADGFTPSSDGSWPLRGEVTSRQPVGRDVTLLYSDGVPTSDRAGGRLGLRVHTSSSSAVSVGYLEEWYRQGAEARGGERPLTSYDQDTHDLTVLWPDGRSISVSPTSVAPSEAPSRATLERIADSLTVASEADVANLRHTSEVNIEALPVLASAETSVGTVEVHGESGFVRLCLRRPGEQGRSCPTDTVGGGSSAEGRAIATAEWNVDGSWYVVVASKGFEPEVVGGHDSGGYPDAGELPAEATVAGDWTVRLVRPAPDIESVCTSADGATSCVHHRDR